MKAITYVYIAFRVKVRGKGLGFKSQLGEQLPTLQIKRRQLATVFSPEALT